MRVLFIFNTPVLKYGSFEDLMIALGEEISLRREEVTYIFPGMGVESVANELRKHGSVHIVSQSWREKGSMSEIKRIILSEKPDVINVHFCDAIGFFPLFFWIRRKGIKLVYHYHGEILPLKDVKWHKRFVSEIRLVTLLANEIITVSHANCAYLRYVRVIPPVRVVHNGIDLQKYSISEVEQVPSDPDSFPVFERYILYIGSLFGRKRIDFLLKAFAIVCDDVGNVGLVVVGGGGKEEEYHTFAHDLGIDDRVVFTGLLKDYPFDLLLNTDFVVSASKQESFGLIFAEALALGIPVVACRVGGIPEVVKDGEVGLLADPNSIEDLAEKMTILLRDAGMHKKFSRRSRAWIEENFDLREKAGQIVDAFQDMYAG